MRDVSALLRTFGSRGRRRNAAISPPPHGAVRIRGCAMDDSLLCRNQRSPHRRDSTEFSATSKTGDDQSSGTFAPGAGGVGRFDLLPLSSRQTNRAAPTIVTTIPMPPYGG